MADRKWVKLNSIQPGKPIENAYAASFNGRLRDECLNTYRVTSLSHASDDIAAWRGDYTEARPYSSLGNKAPTEYALAMADL